MSWQISSVDAVWGSRGGLAEHEGAAVCGVAFGLTYSLFFISASWSHCDRAAGAGPVDRSRVDGDRRPRGHLRPEYEYSGRSTKNAYYILSVDVGRKG